ncbi:MAG TPA: hypothetical protein VHZ78_08505 [Rhizomicrobium sp.]|jgi:hypothetical protein|nr:hypothetical protein [Rhizomicrobium sp.]
MNAQTIITDINKALQIASAIASAASIVEPGATVAGIALDKLSDIGKAAAAGSQDAADYIAKMQALADSTSDPTTEQWASLDAQTDADVQKLEDSTAQ